MSGRGVDRRALLTAMAAGVNATSAGATTTPATTSFDLWPGRPPGAPLKLPEEQILDRSSDPSRPDRILTGVARPRLDHYPATSPTGAAVVVAPGGGYVRIALDKEGVDVGQWLSARGVLR